MIRLQTHTHTHTHTHTYTHLKASPHGPRPVRVGSRGNQELLRMWESPSASFPHFSFKHGTRTFLAASPFGGTSLYHGLGAWLSPQLSVDLGPKLTCCLTSWILTPGSTFTPVPPPFLRQISFWKSSHWPREASLSDTSPDAENHHAQKPSHCAHPTPLLQTISLKAALPGGESTRVRCGDSGRLP